MIDQQTIDRIIDAADIVDVVSDYVTLKRRGVNYEACCPFHNEKTPSFKVSPAKGLFKCFGCGKGGSVVNFVMEIEGLSYPEALKKLATKYGIEVKETELTDEQREANNAKESMFALNSWVADYFTKTLWDTNEGQSVGLGYFRDVRSFSDATIRKFGLGFCSRSGDAMTNAALKAGYREEFLISTGLTIARESDGRLFDRFHDRVIFPVHNVLGRVVAFGGRTLRTDKKVAKYQNSPESDIYSKRRELYGLFFAKKAIQVEDAAIMVEGYTDVISMHQAGIENVVASSGTALTTEQIKLLSRFTKNIIFIYDGDGAGIHAALRGIDMVLAEGMNVKVVLLPEPEDPDSFARSHTAEEVKNYIAQNAENFITFKAKLLLRGANDDPVKRAEVINDIIESIVCIPNAILRSEFIKSCSAIMGVPVSELVAEVAKKDSLASGSKEGQEFIRRQIEQQKNAIKSVAPNRQDKLSIEGSSMATIEFEIIKYLVKYGNEQYHVLEAEQSIALGVAESIVTMLEQDSLKFTNPTYQQIFDIYANAVHAGMEVEDAQLINNSNPEIAQTASSIIMADDNYSLSQIWEKMDKHLPSLSERLAVGVPKIINLFRLKILSQLIAQTTAKINSEQSNEAEKEEAFETLTELNKIKVLLSQKVGRVTI